MELLFHHIFAARRDNFSITKLLGIHGRRVMTIFMRLVTSDLSCPCDMCIS